MDTVAIVSILAVSGTIIVIVFLAIRILKLINSDHSEDEIQK